LERTTLISRVEKDSRHTRGRGIRTSPDPHAGPGAEKGASVGRPVNDIIMAPPPYGWRVRRSASAIPAKGRC